MRIGHGVSIKIFEIPSPLFILSLPEWFVVFLHIILAYSVWEEDFFGEKIIRKSVC